MTDIDPSVLRRHLAPVRQCTSACPDADTLLAFALGLITDDTQRESIAERVGACAQCAAAVQLALASGEWSEALARDLETQSNESKATVMMPKTRNVRRYWLPATVAAGVAALVLLMPLLRAPMPGEVLRGVDAMSVRPANSSLLRSAPMEFRWVCADVPGAATVELLDAAAVRVWSGAIEDGCSVKMPVDAAAGLGSGIYLWRLLNRSGEPIAGPFEFRIAR